MSWRTVVVSRRCKLDLKMGYMVIRAEDITRIFLDEIALLMIENPAVALTGCLLEELAARKIRVIFCDKGRSPYGELVPYYGSHDSSKKLKAQSCWTKELKGAVWSAVITDKIAKQAEHLMELGCVPEAEKLLSNLPQVEHHDATNREGHAAKVYFNALFGKGFVRSNKDDPKNNALNYGYAVLLSAFNRAVTSAGYTTQIGIHHDNIYNHFNFSSDIMEPFRILVDRMVKERDVTVFDKTTRYALVDLLNTYVYINNTRQTVLNAVEIYTRSMLNALTACDASLIRFYKMKL